MNLPYDNAKDSVEFWQPVADTLGITLEYDDSEDSIHPGDCMIQMSGLWYGLEEFTRDMLARCVLWLAERGRSLAMRSTGGWYFPVHGGHDAFDTKGDCIITAYRDAVLAISREGDKQ